MCSASLWTRPVLPVNRTMANYLWTRRISSSSGVLPNPSTRPLHMTSTLSYLDQTNHSYLCTRGSVVNSQTVASDENIVVAVLLPVGVFYSPTHLIQLQSYIFYHYQQLYIFFFIFQISRRIISFPLLSSLHSHQFVSCVQPNQTCPVSTRPQVS